MLLSHFPFLCSPSSAALQIIRYFTHSWTSEVIDSVRFLNFLIIVYRAVSFVSLVNQRAGLRVFGFRSHWFIRWFALLTKLSL